VFENYLNIPFAPYLWHSYRVVSSDMRAYDLFIDGRLAHHGTFRYICPGSYISWGDGTQGAASLHHWDYVRVGVVPEPRTLRVLLIPGTLLLSRGVTAGARRGASANPFGEFGKEVSSCRRE